ncbi:unnamed protein product [Bursaphelenchus okinawaensis]|uniref:Reverse transcriptase RNase H-like domain-containing protein n=1 Tax=Bursaphelenchus okinawaensis TaxID=465554 RepID=A0A811LR86_9BILA|nr:unnamed protein product [Bursaphelenchus okinawaensis]CAG9128056.1 unnamed protein product [Bursaphelenchus okinawaensis]
MPITPSTSEITVNIESKKPVKDTKQVNVVPGTDSEPILTNAIQLSTRTQDIVNQISYGGPPELKEKFFNLVEEYNDVFALHELELGVTNVTTHVIDTGDAKPLKQAPYCTNLVVDEFINKTIDDGIKRGAIRKSNSPWAAPIVVVPKKGNQFRMCINYKKLNTVTKSDSYPVPNIDIILSSLVHTEAELNAYSAAFTKLKDIMADNTVLASPDYEAALSNPKRKFILATDASKVGFGAALHQCDESGKMRPIAFVSRRSTPVESRLPSSEAEATAILFGCEKLDYILLATPTLILTDNKALIPLLKKECTNPRIEHMFSTLSQKFNLEIKYIKGSANSVADFLSRAFENVEAENTLTIQTQISVNSINTIEFANAQEPWTEKAEWSRTLEQDLEFSKVYQYLKFGLLPEDLNLQEKWFWRKKSTLCPCPQDFDMKNFVRHPFHPEYNPKPPYPAPTSAPHHYNLRPRTVQDQSMIPGRHHNGDRRVGPRSGHVINRTVMQIGVLSLPRIKRTRGSQSIATSAAGHCTNRECHHKYRPVHSAQSTAPLKRARLAPEAERWLWDRSPMAWPLPAKDA